MRKRGLVDLNARVQSQKTQFRQTGGVTYVNAQQLGATGTPWVSVTGSSDAAEAVNSLVAGLTPANVLESLHGLAGAATRCVAAAIGSGFLRRRSLVCTA